MKNPRSSLFLISLTFCCRWRQLQGYRCSASTTDKFKATAVKLEAGGVKDAELALRAWRICVCALNTCRRALRILRNERANKTPRGSFCFHGMFGDITFCVTQCFVFLISRSSFGILLLLAETSLTFPAVENYGMIVL